MTSPVHLDFTTGPIIGLIGHGVTGSRVAGHLLADGVRVAAYDPAPIPPRPGLVRVDDVTDLMSCDLVVLCSPAPHSDTAERFLRRGIPVVSLGDDLDDLRALVQLHDAAEEAGVGVVVGAGMAPGLSGLLARYLAAQLHQVEELHVAVHGTGGPACARQHHHALGDTALGWHDGDWIEPPGGSGRELVWFPEPVLAHDCYRAALGDPLLLRRSFPQTQRISARMSATRRDRLTARFPMLTPPHAAGDLGSVRVEARGSTAEGERLTLIAGASGPTGELAAAVCAATALMVVRTPLTPGVHTTACRELTEGQLLHHTTRLGVRVQEFTGVARATSW